MAVKFQVGDKVRLLNEAVEGVVSRILSNSRVEVATPDGFTLTAFGNELVRIDFEIGMAVAASPPIPGNRDVISAPEAPAARPKKVTSILSTLDADDTLYAAVVLNDVLAPLTTDIELFLVNNSAFSLSFVCSRRFGDTLELCLAGALAGREEKSMGMFSQDELHSGNGFHFSMLFYKPGNYSPRPPFEKTLHIESNQFLDSRLWEKAGGAGNRVLLTALKQMSLPQEPPLEQLLDKYSVPPENLRKDAAQRPGKSKPAQKYVILAREKVVDLHIEELIKDFSNLNNAQIISHQINYFLKEMDRALIDKLHKITFIHGIGQGVLKSAIREELKKFDHIRFGEGPPEKYGYGATEVIFD